MRIYISHHTVRKGFVLRTTSHEAHLKVAFTHEEKQIIRQRNLLKSKLMDRRPANARVDDREEKFVLRAEQLQRAKQNRSIKQLANRPVVLAMFLLSRIAAIKLILGSTFAMNGCLRVIQVWHACRNSGCSRSTACNFCAPDRWAIHSHLVRFRDFQHLIIQREIRLGSHPCTDPITQKAQLAMTAAIDLGKWLQPARLGLQDHQVINKLLKPRNYALRIPSSKDLKQRALNLTRIRPGRNNSSIPAV
ncbi:hypothetical protein [Sulfitobacter sediminilitoris]|uniref:hypothetical protein n=1 Tax=Sulfitobacter sediminilitoris TaxID=2698830 RepID=UPI001953C301|nr:hypothetical protein [Sulfitobacter sediminilitoris]